MDRRDNIERMKKMMADMAAAPKPEPKKKEPEKKKEEVVKDKE